MNSKIIKQAKRVALSAVAEAGLELKKIYNRPSRINSGLKSKHQIVTRADKLAEKIIFKHLRKSFFDHSILSEEAGLVKKAADYLWIVDPLDGTTNFVMKNPLFSTTLAMVYKNEVVISVIYAPVLAELYVAIKGQGAFYNHHRLRVSGTRDPKRGFHTYCYGTSQDKFPSQAIDYYQKMFMSGHEIRQLGAATLEFARVARGIADSIVIPGANSWDVAAGALLVREAGGRVTDFKNQPWNLTGSDIIATNGLIHNRLLRLLNEQRKR